MKSWIFGGGLVLLGLAGGLRAQEGTPDFDPLGDFADAPRLIRVQVEFIEVAHPTLTELLRKPRGGTDDSGLRDEVGKLAEAGKATVLETMACISRSGERATSESIEEYIYPTEYEPAEMPGQIRIEKGSGDPGAMLPELATGPTPTAFEQRDLGATLEVEPVLGEDSRMIDLRFAPEIVYHVGDDTWAEWKDRRGDASVRMPRFYKLAVNTAVTLIAGQPLMVAALSPKDEEGFPDFRRKVMVFVRCDVLTVGR